MHYDLVETQSAEQFAPQRVVGRDLPSEGGAHCRMRGVDLDHLTGFGVLQPRGTDIGQHAFRRIFERDGDDVVALGESRQRLLEIVGEKVGREEDHRAMRQQPHEPIDRDRDRGAASDWRGRHEIANQAQRVFASLARGQCMFDPIGEHHQADTIVVAGGRERQHTGHLDGQFVLEMRAGAEARRARHVDHEHDGELSFFDIAFDERAPHAGRYVPVDRAHFIARLVLAYFGELHSLPFEERPVLAGEAGVDEPACAHLDAAHLSQHLGGRHRHW